VASRRFDTQDARLERKINEQAFAKGVIPLSIIDMSSDILTSTGKTDVFRETE
jgi:hypothetical protein